MVRIASRLLSKEDMERKTGLSNSTIYRAIKEAGFPEPVRVGRKSYWPEHAVDNWFDNRKLLGLRGPFARRSPKQRTQKAPKPRIVRDNGAWAIKASNDVVFRSSSPALVYQAWQEWGQTCNS